MPPKPAPPGADPITPETMMQKATEVLQETFNMKSFKPMQSQVVRRLLVDNESAALILPTGGGKSLTYQLPSVILKGLCIVVSPLLALTKDQIDGLRLNGVRAETLDSTLSLSEAAEVRDKIRSNNLDILYVTPERLNNASFINLLQGCRENGLPVDLVAVDEAHCVSEWGHSFRPDYLKVARFVKEVDAKRVLALTATATAKVVQDICVQFGIDFEKGCFRACSYRENLHLNAITTPSEISKRKEMNKLLSKGGAKRGGVGIGDTIVYTTTQENTEELAKELKEDGFDAKHYHAGMRNDERKAVQDWFMEKSTGFNSAAADSLIDPGDDDDEDKENRASGPAVMNTARAKIVVATIAFGMGIDKRDIRNVIHHKLPKTLEGYTQEIGRAGRDGLPSSCTIFLSSRDTPTIEGFIRGDTPTLPSLETFMNHLFQEKGAGKAIGDEIELSLYNAAKLCDIKDGVLKLILTYLELEHGFFRATTPKYKSYQLQFLPGGMAAIKKDKSDIAKEIVGAWREAATWTYLEVDNVSAPYSQLLSKLGSWENSRYIFMKPSNVSNMFIVSKPVPNAKACKEIAGKLYDRLLQKETDDLDRLKGVIAYGTNKGCLAVHLAAYFGDKLPSHLGEKCGNCSFCRTGKAAKPIKSTVGGSAEDGGEEGAGKPEDVKKLIGPVLAACGVRDDPMLLARLAFGVFSPRISALKLTKEPVYGSLDYYCSFEELLAAFKEECEKVKYVNIDGWDSEMTGAKKEAPKYTSSYGNKPKSGGSSAAYTKSTGSYSKGKTGSSSYGSYGSGSKRTSYQSFGSSSSGYKKRKF